MYKYKFFKVIISCSLILTILTSLFLGIVGDLMINKNNKKIGYIIKDNRLIEKVVKNDTYTINSEAGTFENTFDVIYPEDTNIHLPINPSGKVGILGNSTPVQSSINFVWKPTNEVVTEAGDLGSYNNRFVNNDYHGSLGGGNKLIKLKYGSNFIVKSFSLVIPLWYKENNGYAATINMEGIVSFCGYFMKYSVYDPNNDDSHLLFWSQPSKICPSDRYDATTDIQVDDPRAEIVGGYIDWNKNTSKYNVYMGIGLPGEGYDKVGEISTAELIELAKKNGGDSLVAPKDQRDFLISNKKANTQFGAYFKESSQNLYFNVDVIKYENTINNNEYFLDTIDTCPQQISTGKEESIINTYEIDFDWGSTVDSVCGYYTIENKSRNAGETKGPDSYVTCIDFDYKKLSEDIILTDMQNNDIITIKKPTIPGKLTIQTTATTIYVPKYEINTYKYVSKIILFKQAQY